LHIGKETNESVLAIDEAKSDIAGERSGRNVGRVYEAFFEAFFEGRADEYADFESALVSQKLLGRIREAARY
jgi:hypothetical protein